MDSNGIIPDVIDSVPEQIAKVTYPSGVSVEVGKELTPTQVKDVPNVTWEAEPDTIYAIVMVDPDVPSRANPTMREALIWSVVNIPGNDLSKGYTMVEYFGAAPSKESGLHRYIFWVFKQPNGIFQTDRFISKTTREGRMNIKTRDYITKYHMGNPVAGNYFVAQHDSYVDAYFASMMKK